MTDPDPAHRKRSPTARTLLILLAAGVFFAHAATYRGYLLDDAYISLRYAENQAAGHGLVWKVTSVPLRGNVASVPLRGNHGERVEGYTNFLWVLLGALFLILRLDAMAALQATSALAILGVLVLTWRLERIAASAVSSALLPAITCSLPRVSATTPPPAWRRRSSPACSPRRWSSVWARLAKAGGAARSRRSSS